MKIDQLKYTKGSHKRTLLKENRYIGSAIDISEHANFEGDGKIEPDLLIVISGGERRERQYLEQLNKQGCRSFYLLFVSPQGKKSGKNHQPHPGSSPRFIVDCWKQCYNSSKREFMFNGRCYELSDLDNVFFISDVDDFREELNYVMQESDDQVYKWIINNPCFEMWLYYSYTDEHPQTHLGVLHQISEKSRPSRLKKINSEIFHGGTDPRKAFNNIQVACANASKHHPGVDNNGIPLLFGVQMQELASLIIHRINSEAPSSKAKSFKENLRQ